LGHYFSAPLFPLLGVALLALMLLPLGWIMIANVGVVIAGVTWGLVLLVGFLAAILLLGLLFGWPLMWVAISAEERGDAFEGLQRSYAFTFGRPLHYLFYAVLTVLLGALGWLLVWFFSETIAEWSYWGVSWGTEASENRLQTIRQAVEGTGGGGTALGFGGFLIGLWVKLLRTVAVGFVYSFFWCAASAIYLLLRRDVDQTEFDDVFVAEEEDREALPPLEDEAMGDQKGVVKPEPEYEKPGAGEPEAGSGPHEPGGDDKADESV
jgi:hypothetical protein